MIGCISGLSVLYLPIAYCQNALSDNMYCTFGVSDNAMLDIVFGRYAPQGKLPFELPSSMAEVEVQFEDVPDDTVNPLFPFGWGLTYPEG